MYQHVSIHKKPIALHTSKIVCVGRNYLEHIQELKNEKPTKPVLFMKPSTSLCSLSEPIALPSYSQDCQHEIELAVLLLSPLSHATVADVKSAIWGYGIALDLTLRDIQTELKQKGLPWEMAKAFDKACPVSEFVPAQLIPNPQNVELRLTVNGAIRQQGNTQQMIYGIHELIAYISNYFTLLPGDVVLTGTPAGVGTLKTGDALFCSLTNQLEIHTHCV